MYLQGNGAKSFSTPLGVAFDTTLRLKKEIADFDGCLNDSRTTVNSIVQQTLNSRAGSELCFFFELIGFYSLFLFLLHHTPVSGCA